MNRFPIAFLGCLVLLATGSAARADVEQWDFDTDLESTTGQTALVENVAQPGDVPDFAFETVTIGGASADVVHFQRGTYFRVMPGLPPNGGGTYVNQYTIVMDVMFPDRSPSGGWAALLQTNEVNGNDGDWFVNPAGGLGIDNNYGGSVPEGEWHRVALVVDLVAGTYTSYLDGTQVQQNVGQTIDNRFSLYSVNDGGNDGFSIFADDTGDNAEGFVNSLQFRDVALTPADIAAIGGPSADGIPIPSDPRDCSFRSFSVKYDRATNHVNGTWLPLPGEHGFRVFRGASQVGGDLAMDAVNFTDASPPFAGTGIVYTLKPLRLGGAVERECPAAPLDTFGCIDGLACCPDQASKHVTLSWQAPVNLAASGFRVDRDGAQVGIAGPADTSFTDGAALAAGIYSYEVTVLSAGNPVCSLTCKAAVTGVPILPPGSCGGVVATYDFNGDLKSSTGGRDLIAQTSLPIDPITGSPEFSFESADIGGKNAQVCRYSRGTIFRLFTGMGPNGGGQYTNQYTLILDVLFESGAIDESGWAALYQTNDVNDNDGDWFVRGTDRGLGIDGNYGGIVEDDVWHRLALVLDTQGGTLTSYVDGVQVQQNLVTAVDDRFSLYTYNHGDSEGITLFADESGDNSGGLVNSAQIRDVAMSADEVAAFGGPTADGIPATAPCPHGLACGVNQAAKSVTLTWNKGFGLPGTAFTIRRNGAAIGSVPLTTETFTDPGLSTGIYFYEVSLDDKDSGCLGLPLQCQAEILGSSLFFDDFDSYADDNQLALAGWEIRDESSPVENDAWTVLNPGHRRNPPTFNGRPSNGRFVISDSDNGGSQNLQNTAGSGASYDLWSPSFATTGASTVWLHFDAVAQLNNDGDAVFDVDVSTDNGSTWNTVVERVSPGRALDPPPVVDDTADGLYGRVHVDLSGLAANKASVRLRFRHFEPTFDWWVALDNVLVDSNRPTGSVEVLPREGFASGIPAAWKKVSGPGSDTTDPWSTDDTCSLSLEATGGTFPDAQQGRMLHHLGIAFAIIDPVCSSARADEYLITPALDLTSKSRVFLSVSSAAIFTKRAVAEILVSLDGGATFQPSPLFSYNGGGLAVNEEEPYFNELVLEAPAAAGKANVAFAFHYRSASGSAAPAGSWWAIDDVMVTGEPSGSNPVFHRGDSDGNGSLQLTDAVRILNVLFLGVGTLSCKDAADADDNGSVQLTDAVRILNVLFLGVGTIPAPGAPPLACGPDPGGELGCESYTACN